MPFPRKSYHDRQASPKEVKSSATAPLDAQATTATALDEKAGLALSPIIPSSKIPKDTRAYEHERQRLRKAADFVKMRARKAQQGTGWVGNAKAHQRTASGKSSAGGGLGAVPSEKGRLFSDEETELDEGEGLVLSDSWKENLGIVTEQSRYEVKLADLVRPGKPRKPKGGDGDFEVVPHVRSVIVLDDNTPDELDIDEPWEHIYNTDSEDNKELSYAQVAALSK
ncbi:hypothetical protein P691DRAFT_806666 [Macrolepiota fuliginosa MF-IS2]|uniref:Uncharacterized protein n=1 Tax=Macrolepiota fuliginosa MF-IS2 TaxID=1400762 RepID=A0A9P6C0M4_9AGAR|nr:hypothetical protein P691DRAFT_806666 [Macrolepiota fuliginosa MF-IS2]